MGKKDTTHTVKIEVPQRKYQRYMYPDPNNNRVIIVDLRCIRTTPWNPVDYGKNRHYIWKNPEQLQALVNEYFSSCFGPIRNPKTGGFFLNSDGSLTIGQIKPFTISGLALYCHMETWQLRDCSHGKIDNLGFPTDEDYIGPTYSEIILKARKRIENYAEEQLYNRDGFNGGKFVLDCAFNWVGRREQAEIDSMKKQNKLKKKELKFRKQQAALDEETEEPVTITIKRAGE